MKIFVTVGTADMDELKRDSLQCRDCGSEVK